MCIKRLPRKNYQPFTPKKGLIAIAVVTLSYLLTGFVLLSKPEFVFAGPNNQKADRVIVKKEKRILILMRKDRILYTFSIVLGGQPEGDKLEEGDWRTPEGQYVIDWRIAHSRFYKSLHISYPSQKDRFESAAEDVEPGGMIMIHGYPPEALTKPEKYEDQDWTDGCIALQNRDMDIVWSAVDDGTPIEIFP